ncbi:MAG TPA: hypothetical protein VIJ42_09200 [Stellaceae bacterium]
MARDPLTLDLLNWEPPDVASGSDHHLGGRASLDHKIARLVSRALQQAREEKRVSRHDVVNAMSSYLGRRLSVQMLEKWASEGSESHRIPLDVFAALIDATEYRDLIGFVPSLFGHIAVRRRYGEIIELHLIEEHERDIAERKRALPLRWRGR